MSITAKQRKAIEALASGSNNAQAAAIAGVSEPTFYNWKADAEFMAELRRVNEAILDDTVQALTRHSKHAVTLLGAVIADDDEDTRLRVQAAKIILDSTLALKSMYEFEQRLSALEGDTV